MDLAGAPSRRRWFHRHQKSPQLYASCYSFHSPSRFRRPGSCCRLAKNLNGELHAMRLHAGKTGYRIRARRGCLTKYTTSWLRNTRWHGVVGNIASIYCVDMSYKPFWQGFSAGSVVAIVYDRDIGVGWVMVCHLSTENRTFFALYEIFQCKKCVPMASECRPQKPAFGIH